MHIHDHLPSTKQLIADKFAGSQSDGRFSVCHSGVCDCCDAVDKLTLSTDRTVVR